MPNERIRRLFGRLRSSNLEPSVDPQATQRARPRSEFSWHDLKLNLKMLLMKSRVSTDGLYEELLIPSLSGQFDLELYIRWLQSICLVPFFDETIADKYPTNSDIVSVLELRTRLKPYLKAVVASSRDYKWAILKSFDKVEPENTKAKGIDDSYFIGECVLVAPIIAAGAVQRYVYLPPGTWYNFWSNVPVVGGQYTVVDAPLGTTPIFVRGGAVLPLNHILPDNRAEDHTTLVYRIYPGDYESVLYEDDTQRFDEERGDYRWIYVTCGWEAGTLVIKRRIAGQFIPPYAQIRVEVIGLKHEPVRMSIDMRPAPLWFFDEGILEFTTEGFQVIEVVLEEDAEQP